MTIEMFNALILIPGFDGVLGTTAFDQIVDAIFFRMDGGTIDDCWLNSYYGKIRECDFQMSYQMDSGREYEFEMLFPMSPPKIAGILAL